MDAPLELAQLRTENVRLREELRASRVEVEALRVELGAVDAREQALLAQQAVLQAENSALHGEVEGLELRVEELERQTRGQPAHMKASKAPAVGARGPRRKRAAERNRGRKRAAEVTRHEAHRLERCPDCGRALRGERLAWRREVVELPPLVAVEVVQHEVYEGHCQHCGAWKRPELAEAGVTFGQRRLGPRLCALIGYLRTVLGAPDRAIQAYVATMHGVEVSLGAIEGVVQAIAQRGRGAVVALREGLRQSAVVHADETGWRENGQNGWVWVFSTPGEQGVRYFVYDRHRSQAVVARELGEGFHGLLASDFCSAYNVYTGPHQRCWAHLLRDLHALQEEHAERAEVVAWAEQVQGLYERGRAHTEGLISQPERERVYAELVAEVERLALPHARCQCPCRALAKRLLRHLDELFQFVRVAGLAADNNLAERSLRPLVVLRKISGGTRSGLGSATRMALASLFGTWRLRGLNPFTQCLQLISPSSLG